MTRVLTFTGEKAPMRFALVRLALLGAGDGKGERTRAIIRHEARLLDALDSVSAAAPCDLDADRRLLIDVPKPVTLTQEDFDLLSTYLDKTPWTPRASRDAVDCQDWLSAAEKVE